jgi:hypothetical protein
MIDLVQRAILENQIILAEALWMLIHTQGSTTAAMLDNVSARIAATRKVIEEEDLRKIVRHTRRRMTDVELIVRIKDALGTDEDGEALVEVARNAHRAEMELASHYNDDDRDYRS